MSKMSSTTSIFQTLKNNQSLPLSQQQDPTQDPPSTIRRRLSSVSLKSMSEYSSPATTWAFQRSKSVSAMGQSAGTSIVKWWGWGWDWILSRKPPFALDLEMSEEERGAIGWQSQGSWRHVFFKIKNFVGGAATDKAKLAGKYDSVSNYFKNFDNKRHMLPH